MGLGKTVTSLAIMSHYFNEWPLLILCPASLRFTWASEIEKFFPLLNPDSIYCVQGLTDAAFVKKSNLKVVILTYSLLRNDSVVGTEVLNLDPQCIICDESHNLKEKSTQRVKHAMPLLEKAKRLLMLSGTPALAKPVELWVQLYSVDAKLFGKYTPFTKNYCNARRGRFAWDVSGISNAAELNAKLSKVMIRRLKKDVLNDLPDKQRSVINVTMDKNVMKKNDNKRIIEDMKKARVSIDHLVGEEASNANFEARKLLMAAYKNTGTAKADSCASVLVDWLEGTDEQKCLIFGHHAEVLDKLEVACNKQLKGGGSIRIDGKVSPMERNARVQLFQNDPKIRVAVLSVTAAGVGLTLTAASTVFFAELHWTPGVLAQAEDRVHRIGQKNAVNINYLLCDDDETSIDNQLWGMIAKKVKNVGMVVDGSNAERFDANTLSEFASSSSAGNSKIGSSNGDGNGDGNTATKKRPFGVGSIESFFGANGAKKIEVKENTKPPTKKSKFDAAEKDTLLLSCPICTYDNVVTNTNVRASTFKCEMCGAINEATPDMTPLTPETKLTTPTITPTTPSVQEQVKPPPRSSPPFPTPPTVRQPTDKRLLKFSFSRYTDRISVHFKDLLLGINFLGSDLITSVTSIARDIDLKIDSPFDYEERIISELTCLGRNFQLLTPLNLKLLKENDESITTCDNVIQVANALSAPLVGGVYDRSVKGAGADASQCAWCGDELEKNSASDKGKYNHVYCSFDCAEKQRLRCSSTAIRSQLFALERGVCQMCGLDAHVLFKRISALQPCERLNALLNKGFVLPKSSVALQKLLNNPKENDFWQADHRIAVAMGGGLCGMENFQTLCTPCHKKDTQNLARELIVGTGSKRQEIGSRNIRDIFISKQANNVERTDATMESDENMVTAEKTKTKTKTNTIATIDLTGSDDEAVVLKVKRKKKKSKKKKLGD